MPRRIGSLEVPAVGLGCNSLGVWASRAASVEVVHAALDAGATYVDTADAYGDGASEEILGTALAGRRDEAVIGTKFGMLGRPSGVTDASPEVVATSLEASLRRLGTDHVDLYLLHFPDPGTPVDDTMGALDDLVTAGKVREVGVCNVDAAQVDAWVAASTDHVRIAAVQNEWSLLRRRIEVEVLPACRELGIPIVPHFPLASGLLTGKYAADEPPPEGSRFAKAPSLGERYLRPDYLDAVDRLRDWAGDHGHSLLELAVSWLTSHDAVATVITGASRPEQVAANVAAADWVLDADERTEIDALLA